MWNAQLGGRPDQPDYDGLHARRIATLPHPADGVPWALAVAGREGGVWLTDARGERRTELWPAHRRVRMLTAVTPPDGHPIVALVEEEQRYVRLVDVGTGRELGPPEGLIPPVLSADRVRSLHVHSAAGRVAALLVHYEVTGPRSVVWLPGSWTRVRKHGESVGAALPFGARTVVMNSAGMIELHGDCVDDVRVVGKTPRNRTPLPPAVGRTPTGDGLLAVVILAAPLQHAIQIVDLEPVGGTTYPRSLRHSGVPLTHVTRLERPEQDLIVAACSDDTLRVWNPTRPDREPLTVPLPGAATDVSTAAPDLVHVLVDEHWLALRLTGLGPLLSA